MAFLFRWLMRAFLALALLLGPGLVVNTDFKSHYGRPRPRQDLDIGGT